MILLFVHRVLATCTYVVCFRPVFCPRNDQTITKRDNCYLYVLASDIDFNMRLFSHLHKDLLGYTLQQNTSELCSEFFLKRTMIRGSMPTIEPSPSAWVKYVVQNGAILIKECDGMSCNNHNHKTAPFCTKGIVLLPRISITYASTAGTYMRHCHEIRDTNDNEGSTIKMSALDISNNPQWHVRGTGGRFSSGQRLGEEYPATSSLRRPSVMEWDLVLNVVSWKYIPKRFY